MNAQSHATNTSGSSVNMGEGIHSHPLSALATALAASSQLNNLPALPQQSNSTSRFVLQLLEQTSTFQRHLDHPSSAPGGLHLNNTMESLLQQLVMLCGQVPSAHNAPNATKLDTFAGTLEDDERICIDAITSGRSKGLTTRQALEGLHGVNNHTAGSWKDYYLEYQAHLDALIIKRKSQGPSSSVHRSYVPMPRHTQYDDLTHPVSQRSSGLGYTRDQDGRIPTVISARRENAAMPNSTGSLERQHEAQAVTSRKRETPSSRSRKRAVVHLPSPPSRSPTPPPAVDMYPGRKTTHEERNFLVRSIQWQLRQDPGTSYQRMAARLAEKLPGRTLSAWRRIVCNTCRKTVDELIVQANVVTREEERSDRERQVMNREEQFNDGYELIYPSEDDIDECEAASQASIESDAQEAYFNDAHGPARRMLNHVSTDMRSMAEFIAHDATWGDASRASSWMSFEAKYPHRSKRAWAEFYRRNQGVIDSLTREYKHINRPQDQVVAPAEEDREHCMTPPINGSMKANSNTPAISWSKRRREEASLVRSNSDTPPAKQPKLDEQFS